MGGVETGLVSVVSRLFPVRLFITDELFVESKKKKKKKKKRCR